MDAFDKFDSALARVKEAATRGTLSHAIAITGAGDRLSAARYCAAAMECTDPREKPCLKCLQCSKALRGIHPDVVVVEDPEHVNISVAVVRTARAELSVTPNEGARKVLIFPDCSVLPPAGQNALLKVVEEGPPYASFLFCAETSAQLLETIRSRCVELRLQDGETHEEDNGLSPFVEDGTHDLLTALTGAHRGAVTACLIQMERTKDHPTRIELSQILTRLRAACAHALLAHYGRSAPADLQSLSAMAQKGLTRAQLTRVIAISEHYIKDCSYNVAPKQVLGALAVELEGLPWQR